MPSRVSLDLCKVHRHTCRENIYTRKNKFKTFCWAVVAHIFRANTWEGALSLRAFWSTDQVPGQLGTQKSPISKHQCPQKEPHERDTGIITITRLKNRPKYFRYICPATNRKGGEIQKPQDKTKGETEINQAQKCQQTQPSQKAAMLGLEASQSGSGACIYNQPPYVLFYKKTEAQTGHLSSPNYSVLPASQSQS